jgi:Protein of unknown function (DUF2723)
MQKLNRALPLWLAWFVPFAVYVCSLNREVGYWDVGEMQTVPWILGIPHPTGFPLYVVTGWLFSHAVPFGAVSWRMALFSALAFSLAAWAIARAVTTLADAPWIGAATAIAFAFGDVAWVRATRAEVHSLACAFGLLAIAAACDWYRSGRPRSLYWAAALTGCGVATHPIVAMIVPALAVLAFARTRELRVRTIALTLALGIIPLCAYAYLPLRSAYVVAHGLDPTLAIGVAPGRPFWNTNDPRTREGFVREVTGSEFQASGALAKMISPQTYAEKVPDFLDRLLAEITPFGAVLGIAGIVLLLRTDRAAGFALLLAFAVPVAFTMAYSIEADRDRYYLIPFAALWIATAIAITRLINEFPIARLPAAAALLLVIGSEVSANRGLFSQPRADGARSTIVVVQRYTQPDAILIAPWLYATPLAYAAYVEHSLDRRVVETGWLSDDAALVPAWRTKRHVYVVGKVFGSVPGYHLVELKFSTPLYRVEKD